MEPDEQHELVDAVRRLTLVLERLRGEFARRHGLVEHDAMVLSHLVASGGSLSTETRAIAEPPCSSRPSAKVAMFTLASPSRPANLPMKPGLSSFVT